MILELLAGECPALDRMAAWVEARPAVAVGLMALLGVLVSVRW